MQSVVELSEFKVRVHAKIAELSEKDREVIVLRGIEQLPNTRVAEKLGESTAAVAMRYGRALKKLRSMLPESVFHEFANAEEAPGQKN